MLFLYDFFFKEIFLHYTCINNNPIKLTFCKKYLIITSKLQQTDKNCYIIRLILTIELFNDLTIWNILGTGIQIRVLVFFFFSFSSRIYKKHSLFALCLITEIIEVTYASRTDGERTAKVAQTSTNPSMF